MSNDKKPELKRRSAPAAAKTVANKPRKMSLLKPTRKTTGTNPANSAHLVFPTDRLGITTDIKKAMIKAASKVGKEKDTLDLLEETVRILRGHIQARYKENNDVQPLRRVGEKAEQVVEEKPEPAPKAKVKPKAKV